jgi:hypothetical protein
MWCSSTYLKIEIILEFLTEKSSTTQVHRALLPKIDPAE